MMYASIKYLPLLPDSQCNQTIAQEQIEKNATKNVKQIIH